jgi:hypothetical protein
MHKSNGVATGSGAVTNNANRLARAGEGGGRSTGPVGRHRPQTAGAKAHVFELQRWTRAEDTSLERRLGSDTELEPHGSVSTFER